MATYSINFAITLKLTIGYVSLVMLIKQLTNEFDVKKVIVDADVDFRHASIIVSTATGGHGGLAAAVALGRTSSGAFRNLCFVEDLLGFTSLHAIVVAAVGGLMILACFECFGDRLTGHLSVRGFV
jgi:hypothetical protein